MELDPAQATSLNTLGVVRYRAGQYNEAIGTLEESLAVGRRQSDAFDLFFLAMAHHRLGHRREAIGYVHRAVGWVRQQKNLGKQHSDELAAFRVEAEAVLTDPPSVLPVDVFGPN